jgi:energy-coupling factor transporter ATP-binding protein EcfA2
MLYRLSRPSSIRKADMKIIELRAENIKNLKAIEIRPEGAVVLEGKNGAGKSAVLDSIFMALTGKKIAEPIRNGEKRAEINVDLGNYKIKRVFTAKGDRLEVLSAEGAAFTSPQTMLNEILGNLSFDPLQFAEMGKNAEGMRRQRAMLSALVGLDFTEADKERTRLYDERTRKNREIKGGDPTSYRPSPGQPLPLESLVGAMQQPKPGTPRVEISMAEEIKKVTALEEQARIHEKYEEDKCAISDRRAAKEIEKKMHLDNIKDLEEQIAAAKTSVQMLDIEIKDLESAMTKLPEPANIMPEQIVEARQALLNVEESNKEIRKAIEYDQAMARLEDAKKVVVQIEKEMMDIDLAKEAKIKAAKFPIEGLGLTDQYVTFNGKPFSQLSTGEQIRVSTAVAMALNPTLKIIVVREGSLLDKVGLEAIVALAKEKDYQLWIERVSDDKQVGIYLEDGEIKK